MLLKLLVRLLTPPRIFWNYVKEGTMIAVSNFVPVIAMNSFFALSLFLTYFGLMFLVFQLAYERDTQDILLGYLGIPVVSFFLCSLIRFHYALVRKAQIKMEIFLIATRKYFHVFLLFTIYYTIYVLAFKMVFEIGEMEGIYKIRVIAGVGIFFWVLVRLIFSPFFVIEKGYSARKAMKASFLLTSGRTIKTLMLLLSCVLILSVILGGSIYLVLKTSLLALASLRIDSGVQNLLIWIPGFAGLSLLCLVASAFAFSLLNIAFVMSYDINLRNRFSKKKKLIYEAAIETKRKLEDTGFFQALPPEEEVQD
jgi:hypothetical protein